MVFPLFLKESLRVNGWLQKKVVQLQPQVLGYKLNLAKIYLKAGRKDAARPLVDELSAAGDKFPGQAEVAELKKAL